MAKVRLRRLGIFPAGRLVAPEIEFLLVHVDGRVREDLVPSDRKPTAVVGVDVRKEDICDRFGRDAGSAEAVRQLAKFCSKQFAGTRIDEDRPAAEQNDVGVNRRLHRRFDVRLRHDFRRGLPLGFGEHAENVERRGPVVDCDNVDLSNFEPIKAGLWLFES